MPSFWPIFTVTWLPFSSSRLSSHNITVAVLWQRDQDLARKARAAMTTVEWTLNSSSCLHYLIICSQAEDCHGDGGVERDMPCRVFFLYTTMLVTAIGTFRFRPLQTFRRPVVLTQILSAINESLGPLASPYTFGATTATTQLHHVQLTTALPRLLFYDLCGSVKLGLVPAPVSLHRL